MAKVKNIDAEKIKEYLDIDINTGSAIWKKTKFHGKKAGTINSKGYVVIQVDNVQYTLHRLVWAIANNSNPLTHIDHINGIRDDNRIENLRLANPSMNQANGRLKTNNTSGFRGVYWESVINKYTARIKKDGVSHWLGAFDSKIEAHEAYMKAARQLFGEFAYLGRDQTLYPTV
jgi:hypothetical protein